MKLKGLRAQLCLWHAALMALTLVALALFTYLLLIRFLHSRADAALLQHADSTARQMAVTLYRAETPAGAPRFLSNDLRSWGRYIQVIEGQPEVLDGLLRRLESDPRHKDIRLIDREPVERRMFADWTMASARVSPANSPRSPLICLPATPRTTTSPPPSPTSA